jgi:predicted enzyme related to lactoylglutathione lyase
MPACHLRDKNRRLVDRITASYRYPRSERKHDNAGGSTMNPLRHFAIHCEDVERAKRFYEAVFGWHIEAWGPPNYFLIFPDFPDRTVSGDLQEREQQPSGSGMRGFECTFGVENLRKIADAVVAHGGRIDMTEYRIEGVGNLMYLVDTEGNRFGAMKYDT